MDKFNLLLSPTVVYSTPFLTQAGDLVYELAQGDPEEILVPTDSLLLDAIHRELLECERILEDNFNKYKRLLVDAIVTKDDAFSAYEYDLTFISTLSCSPRQRRQLIILLKRRLEEFNIPAPMSWLKFIRGVVVVDSEDNME